ncbi:LacI family DNA-binding transcriptional regulator [Flavihumibacter petaseus]|uniref:Putative LacI family transcriptional regulator n=1 Tax=Flavihumibacter petaseus NBRC 106054 TaxID=1220578 RepID=A0A0E9MVV2_9BACT|nr:LacI family DNA-binding transcriptional regulator [Flavihumibacter petaseus]GAO41546.1 putative LacI family transcriptional regulator [Flavihumibacter petaseus NBRC 106054]
MSDIISKVTIADIARALKITPATVSRALNNHPGIKEETKLRVKETALRLNYQPNKIASSLRLGKSNIIGVIIPSAEISFFGSVVHGIEKVANENNYNVLIYQTNELFEYEKKGVQTFLQSQVDAVLASISKETINLDHYQELKRRGIPLILFDRANDQLGVSSVVVDDYAGAFEATKHLISQGCRRIAHIGGQQHVSIFNQRLKGYIDALNVHNIPLNDDLIVYGKVSIDSGRECMKQLLALRQPPDAVFAVEDFTALGAIQAIKQAGKVIPDDIAIIGFANEAFGEFLTPSLSTVNQQTVKMGEEAAKMFFEGQRKGGTWLTQPKKMVLEPALICRESSSKR